MPVMESDGLFLNHLDEEPIEEDPDDILIEDMNEMSFKESDEDLEYMSSREAETVSGTASKPHRLPHTPSRHKCTLTDPHTGEPCNADFSRAG